MGHPHGQPAAGEAVADQLGDVQSERGLADPGRAGQHDGRTASPVSAVKTGELGASAARPTNAGAARGGAGSGGAPGLATGTGRPGRRDRTPG